MSFELELKVAIEGAEKAAANLGTLRTKLDDVGASPGVKQLSNDLQKQIDLYGNISRAASLAYDIERGALAEVSTEQKKVLMNQAMELDSLASKTNKSFGNMRGMAQNLGWQMQDVAVQMQMGTNAAVILTQQGSQLVSAFNPLLGAVIAVGGALIGALLPSLFDTGKAAEEMATKAKHLTKELTDLSNAQQDIVNKANGYTIEAETKKYNDLTKEIAEQTQKIKELNAENGKKVFVATSGGAGSGSGGQIYTIDNTNRLAEATEALNRKQIDLVTIQRKINELQIPGAGYLKSLRDEVETVGLTGKALAEYKATREGLKDGYWTEAVALDLLRQKKEADKKATEESIAAQKALQTQHENAVKAGGDFIDNLTKSNIQLQKQLEVGHALTPAQQELINLDQSLTTGKINLSAAQAATAKSIIQNNAALLEQIDAEGESRKAIEDAIKASNEKAAAIEAEAKKQREANEEMGLTKKQLGELEVARINDQIRLAEQQVAIDDLLPACNAETEAHRNTLKALQDLASAKKDGIAAQAAVDAKTEWKKTADSIDTSLTDALMRGFDNGKSLGKNLADTLQNIFKALILKPIIQPAMNMASNAIGGLIGSAGAKDASGNVSGASGMLGMLGPYGAVAGVALAVGGSLISKFNSQQDAKFEKMTAQYRQANQSIGTLLGNANAKSDSINQSIQSLGANGKSLLDVNHGMYQALLDIKTGIAGTAAGFASTLAGGADYKAMGISTGSKGLGDVSPDLGNMITSRDPLNNFMAQIGKMATSFGGAVNTKILNAIWSSKKDVTDSGIQLLGGTLAGILQTGMVGAMTYADVKTTKKFLGIKTSVKVSTATEEMDDLFKTQFADVYASAGDALQKASKTFGVTFDANKLIIDATKLSLKDLSGDALTKEIQSFFSSQLDAWATGLVAGTAALSKYQQVGEGAFETMVRLASQTNIFSNYVGKLGLKFNGVGVGAIDTTQQIADLSGGFDQLNTNMSSYYQNFTSDADKTKDGLAAISKVLVDVGLKMPTTREGFVALVKAADLSTDAGQAQFAALMDVNQAFAQLVPATENVKSQLGTIYDSIASALKTMRGDSEAIEKLQYDQAKATLATALAIAQAGGSLANFAGLDDAISAITHLDQNNFATMLDYLTEHGTATGLLTQLQGYTVVNGSHANGLERVPFNGYIAELHQGERVLTASQASSGDAQTNELRTLRADMRSYMIAIALSNEKIAKCVSRWEGDGMPETRVLS